MKFRLQINSPFHLFDIYKQRPRTKNRAIRTLHFRLFVTKNHLFPHKNNANDVIRENAVTTPRIEPKKNSQQRRLCKHEFETFRSKKISPIRGKVIQNLSFPNRYLRTLRSIPIIRNSKYTKSHSRREFFDKKTREKREM